MRRFIILSASCLFVLALSCSEVLARGGGFRGGGGMGGGFHSGGAAYRTPSMSRPSPARMQSYQPSRPVSQHAVRQQPIAERSRIGEGMGTRQGAGPSGDRMSRPTPSQVEQFLHLPPGQRPGMGSDLAKIGAGAAAGALGAEGARRLLEGQRPGGPDRPGPGDRPGLGERPGEGIRPGESGRPSTLPARHVSNQIRDNLQHKYDHAFTPQWWKDHPNAARAYWDHHHHPWNYWWRAATWGALVGWTAGAAGSSGYGDPIYYDYGENVYYEGDQVFVGGNPVATAEEYYDQASDIATAAPEPTSSSGEDWLPLGVFALSQGTAADSNTVLQLSVNKEGVISGTYYNTATDTARPIKGKVDRESQRAVWTFADGKNTDIIMETGIYNLTQDQTEALVHFGKDKTQQWLMVRLKQPEGEKPEDQKASSS